MKTKLFIISSIIVTIAPVFALKSSAPQCGLGLLAAGGIVAFHQYNKISHKLDLIPAAREDSQKNHDVQATTQAKLNEIEQTAKKHSYVAALASSTAGLGLGSYILRNEPLDKFGLFLATAGLILNLPAAYLSLGKINNREDRVTTVLHAFFGFVCVPFLAKNVINYVKTS